jgi:hypothetical protein
MRRLFLLQERPCPIQIVCSIIIVGNDREHGYPGLAVAATQFLRISSSLGSDIVLALLVVESIASTMGGVSARFVTANGGRPGATLMKVHAG